MKPRVLLGIIVLIRHRVSKTVKSCYKTWSDITILKYDSNPTQLEETFGSPYHGGETQTVVTLCSPNNTNNIFRVVGMAVRVSDTRYSIHSSYIHPDNTIRFEVIGLWDDLRTSSGSKGHIFQPMFPDLDILYLDFMGREMTVAAVRLRETVVDFTNPYYLESTTLTSRAPKEKNRGLAIFHPFSYQLWILLILVTIFMGPLGYLATWSHDHCLQKLRLLVLGDGTVCVNENKVAENVIDISSKDVLVGGMSYSNQSSSKSGRTWKAVMATYSFNMFRSVLNQGNFIYAKAWPIRLVLTHDIVYISAKINSEIRAAQKGRNHFYHARQTFFPQSYGIVCTSGAPFKNRFDSELGKMVQAGLINKWMRDELEKLRKSMKNRDDQAESTVAGGALSLDHLQI
ncbi:putative Glutamate receptor ionotropic, delta-1-like 39 [Homarus americanus]|uniref:Putative Glutamate receptor ionotropic, delta-1-like 39 n=1 Tax=Homarus americanus TaxID=6706 RepID=A0A8J5K1W3_HOMAM|nr:putative Glutamate receptor ionotropic, delta-1-like 39 [Homarus americanus]